MSMARISSGVGVRPTLYLGDCATRTANIAAAAAYLSNHITHAPVCQDFPGPDGIVVVFVIRSAHSHQSLVRGLHVSGFVGCARLHDGFPTVPAPWQAEPCEGDRQAWFTQVRVLPRAAAIGRYLYALNTAASRPGQPRDF